MFILSLLLLNSIEANLASEKSFRSKVHWVTVSAFLISTYCVAGTVLGTRDVEMKGPDLVL